ncbi:MAG: DnaJ domain-containing protein, partial [Candidatus Riflebacteria bacterium]|nr:DnaJ domain-containing protein [Candidatus Riflebacteria bacterium]
MKDYYKILEVSQNARKEDIKKAFKRLAKKNNPDINKGDKHAEE